MLCGYYLTITFHAGAAQLDRWHTFTSVVVAFALTTLRQKFLTYLHELYFSTTTLAAHLRKIGFTLIWGFAFAWHIMGSGSGLRKWCLHWRAG